MFTWQTTYIVFNFIHFNTIIYFFYNFLTFYLIFSVSDPQVAAVFKNRQRNEWMWQLCLSTLWNHRHLVRTSPSPRRSASTNWKRDKRSATGGRRKLERWRTSSAPHEKFNRIRVQQLYFHWQNKQKNNCLPQDRVKDQPNTN